MKAVFRVDASAQLGVGHLVRCLTLARQLQAGGADITFACAPLPSGLVEAIGMHGFDLVAPETLHSSRWDWVVVDHYDIGREREAELRRATDRLMVIDDLADRRHDCDVLLDQNFHQDMAARYDSLVEPDCLTLLGPTYALLRDEFATARRLATRRRELRRVLISFGGSDPTNETQKAVEALCCRDLGDLEVDVVVGGANPRAAAIAAQGAAREATTVHPPTERMHELMLRADLAIGAAGSTSLERCCLGLPTVAITVADNQVDIAGSLAMAGYHRYLGSSAEVTVSDIADELRRIRADFTTIAEMGARGMDLVDGLGAKRVSNEMTRQ